MAVTRIAEAGTRSAAAVEDVLYTAVTDAVRSGDRDRIAATTVSAATLDALAAGERPPLTLREVGAVLDAAAAVEDAHAYRRELEDAVLLWMADAVVDVTDLAPRVGTDPATLRRQLEGEEPLSVTEFATIVAAVRDGR